MPDLREARKLCGGGYSPYCSKGGAEAAEKEFEALLKRMSEDSINGHLDGCEELSEG